MVFAAAAQLIDAHGHHRGPWWPEYPDPCPADGPLGVLGAIAVARGVVIAARAEQAVPPGMRRTLTECLPDRHLVAGVAGYGGGHGLLELLLAETWLGRWWLRRRTVRLLRAAAVRARAEQAPAHPHTTTSKGADRG